MAASSEDSKMSASHHEEAPARTDLDDILHQREEKDAQMLQDKYHIPMKEVLEAHLEQDPKLVKKIRAKIDLRLVPILSLCYMWAFIDRSNLGNANIAGLPQDLGTNIGNRYNILSMIFFIGYCLTDLPTAFVVRKVGPALWIGTVVTLWGILTLCQGFVKTWGQLAVIRILLGFLEGALVPAAMYLLNLWYTRYEIQLRVAGFYVLGNMSSGLAGILAYGIEQLAGTDGLNGWRWIFIIEGIVTVAVGLVSFFIIIDFPEKATVKNSLGLPGFLTPKEAAIVLARVEHDRGDAVEEPYSTGLILGYLRDWKIWEFTLYLILNNTALYAFSYFLPVILNKGFGYSVGYSQLMTFPPYAVAAVWIMICAAVGDYFKFRGPILVFNCILYMIGVSITGYAKDAHARYAGVFLGVMGILGNIPTQWAYQHNNMVGQKKKAIAITAMIMGGAFGGIIAGNIFVAADSPNYRKGFWICISFQIVYFFLVCKNFVLFYIRNRQADRGQIVIEGQPGFRYTY